MDLSVMAAPPSLLCSDGKGGKRQGGKRLIETCSVVFYPNNPSKTNQTNNGWPFFEATRTPHHSLRGYRDMMKGRSDLLERLNLGRSIDHSCNGLQHLWVGIGVVSVCIGFVLPQTDRSHIRGAGI